MVEYYSGILFLTTNRLGDIDEAFHSRIKMSFYYKTLDQERNRQIWDNCLKKIERQNERNQHSTDLIVEYDREEILSFAQGHFTKNSQEKSKWNARQIRNAFETALALARHERVKRLDDKKVPEKDRLKKQKHRTVKLRKKHFKQVAEVMAEYHRYVVRTKLEKSPEELAAEQQLRAYEHDDEYDISSANSRVYRGSNPGISRTPVRSRTPVGSISLSAPNVSMDGISSGSRSPRLTAQGKKPSSKKAKDPSSDESNSDASEESDDDDDDDSD
jgi:hypothetical protein